MTREEKQKAIDAIKISAPFIAMTQEEHNTYIQTRIKLIDWLEQEPCEDAISRQAVLKIIDGWYDNNRDTENIEDLIVLITYMCSVNPQKPKSEWEHDHEILKTHSDGASEMLDKIRAEIEQIEINGHIRDVECFRAGINTALNVIDKYKAESEIHCNYTDSEIAKSFIDDVEAVKDLLPKAESEAQDDAI